MHLTENRERTHFGITQRDYIIASVIVISAFILHFTQVISLPDSVRQFSKYLVASSKFLDGTLTRERLLDFSPLYLWISIAISKYSSNISHMLLLLQSTLTALASGVLFLLLRRHFGLLPSAFGTIAFVLNRSVMVYCYFFEPEITLIFLLLLFLYFVEQRGFLNSFLTGVLLTLCLLTRPSFLLLALFVPVYYWLRDDKRQLKVSVSLFILPLLAGIVIFTVLSGKSFPPPLMNPGTVFYDANNPLSKGVVAVYPPILNDLLWNFPEESDYQHALYRLVARRTTARELSQTEVNRFWSTKAMNYISDYPGRFVLFEIKKLYHLFNGYRWHDISEVYVVDAALQKKGIPAVPFSFVSSLALLGIWSVRRRWKEFFIPCVALLSQTALILTTYSSDRQRLSLLPFLIIFSVAAIASRTNGRNRFIPAALLLILGVTVFSWETQAMKEQSAFARNYDKMLKFQENALALQSAGDLKRAALAQAKAFALVPEYEATGIRIAYLPTGPRGLAGDALREFGTLRDNDPNARLDMAALSIEAGDLMEAERQLLALKTERSSGLSDVLFHLGRIAVRRAQLAEARRYFSEALAVQPGKPNALAHLAVLTGEKTYAERLRRYFDEADALLYLGHANLEQGKYEDAVTCFSKLTAFLPEYWHARVCLAAALSDAGRYREAADVYLSAMGQFPDTVMFPEKIVTAFDKLAQTAPPGSMEHYLYGKVLFQSGDFPKARRVLQACLAASEKKVVADELQRLEQTMLGAGML